MGADQGFAGKVPAHDLDAEGIVLGAVLGGDLDRVSDVLKPEDFYSDVNGAIYKAALDVTASGKAATLVHVTGHLRDREMLAQVGGAAYVAQLAMETVYVSRIDEVARRVRDKARVRRMVAECHRIAAEGYSDVGEVEEWLNASEATIHRVASDREAATTLTLLRDSVGSVFKRALEPQDESGLRTGFPDLDRLLGPMKPGQLIVIGALSGIGKSSLAMNIATSVSTSGHCVLVFSAEMETDELAERALFAAARVDSSKMHSKWRLTQTDFAALTAAATYVSNAAMWIDDRPSISPAQIRSRARRLHADLRRQNSGLGMIVVDYLQLLDGKSGVPKGANREQEVAEIARSLKVLAKEAEVPVLALAQLNADSENFNGGRGRPPRLGDLRESKALGQNADKVILIHNPAANARAEAIRQGEHSHGPLPAEEVDLIVAKNRGSRTGTTKVLFFPSYTLFQSKSDADPPAGAS